MKKVENTNRKWNKETSFEFGKGRSTYYILGECAKSYSTSCVEVERKDRVK